MRAPASALVGLLVALWGCGDDGVARGPARSFVDSDPAARGPIPLTESFPLDFDVEGFGRYTGTIYRPLADGSGAPWPALVLMNGYAATAPMMSWYSEHLASHGYVVLGVSPPGSFALDPTVWAGGFVGGLDALERELARAGSPIEGAVDPARLGALGLSMGAAGAIEASADDGRLRAVVALAPAASPLAPGLFRETAEAARRVRAPTQIQIGTEDCLVGLEGPASYWESIPTHKQYIEINGANHLGYINEGLAGVATPLVITGPISIDCEPTVSYAEQHRLSARYATMWLDRFVYGTERWDDALFGSGVAADLASGALSAARDAPAR